MNTRRPRHLGRSAGAVSAALTLVFAALLPTSPAWAGTGPQLAWSPDTSVSPAAYFYGYHDSFGYYAPVPPGATVTETFTLANTGGQSSAALTVTLDDPTGAPAFALSTDGCTGVALGPGHSCQVAVSFTEPADGSVPVVDLVASSPKPAAPLATLRLIGSPPDPQISITPSTVDLGTVPAGSTVSQTFTLANTGDVGFPYLILGGGGSYLFDLTGGTCVEDMEFPVGSTCTAVITFDAQHAGDFSDAFEATGLDSTGQINLYTAFAYVTGTAS